MSDIHAEEEARRQAGLIQQDAGEQAFAVTTTQQGGKRVRTLYKIAAPDAWLYYLMEEQAKILRGIRTAVTILAVLAVMGVILAGCSALTQLGR